MNISGSSSRRGFLKQASCAAVGSALLFSTLFSLRMTASAASAETFSDYKALVCLFLAGGNDSYNMLIPRQIDAYNEYAAVRTTLALPSGSLLPITSTGQPYSEFGLHPNLPFLQTLYNQSNAAFVANVGTLIEPTTLAQYQGGSVSTPLGLFSHSDQQAHWQTMVPQVRGGGPKGWAGRMADCLTQGQLSGQIAMNISLDGNNILQTGVDSVPYITEPSGVTLLDEYANPASQAAVDSVLSQHYKNQYQQTLATTGRSSIDTAQIVSQALGAVSVTETFPETSAGKQLRAVAHLLGARTQLNMNRQIFFVQRGGWDHHTEVLNSQEELFTELNAALESFWNELGNLGLQDDVVLFTVSDFGRTLTSNGVGSDHAWGGNHFMIGGPVNGGQIYGDFPELAQGSALDIGRGRLLPTTSTDVYGVELASWFGVPATELATVFPNAGNFFNPLSTPYPLGALATV